MNTMTSLTPIEVAELLKITKNTVYEIIKRGDLPAYKVGNKYRVDIKDVENYINKQKNPNGRIQNLNVSNCTNINYVPNNTVSLQEIIISGQDVLLDILANYIQNSINGIKTFRSHLGSYNGLYELYNNRVSISSCHLWDLETDSYNAPYVKSLLPGIPCVLVNLAYRQQGFYVQKGNPKNIKTYNDLVNNDITFVNREKGSGTRILLDQKLKQLSILPSSISGYNSIETSHLSVASTVSRGNADVGLGSEKAALQVNNIDFIPLQTERYDLVIKQEDLSN
ncbi:MAG: substrate-binding domain-containing protein, partial [Peptostreptococcaceae bacterium]